MKRNKYSKGKWSSNNSKCQTSINCGEKHICMVNWYNDGKEEHTVTGEEHEANVRLIENAPRMKKILDVIFEELHKNNAEYLVNYNYASKIRQILNDVDNEGLDPYRICYHCGGVLTDKAYNEWENGPRCCNGLECGCMGLPVDPPCCDECENQNFKKKY